MITQCRFLHLALSQHPSYPRILSPLKSTSPSQPSAKFLDVGTGLGQDIRKLLHDGVPATAITGLELDARFLDYGHDLFRDQTSQSGISDVTFLIDDVLALGSATSTSAHLGTFTVLQVASLLHLFPLEKQYAAACAFVRLLAPNPGSTILGWQIGSPSPMDYFDMANFSLQYRHSEESWREFWEEVGRRTGTRWEVCVCEMRWREETVWGEPGYWALVWEVRRV